MKRRPEVVLAWILGAALPLLEIARRRTNFQPLPAYVDDLIVGGFLLVAAWASERGRRLAPALRVAAFGVLCGGMYGSFFGQLEIHGDDISGLPSSVVVVIKGAICLAALIGLGLSICSATKCREP